MAASISSMTEGLCTTLYGKDLIPKKGRDSLLSFLPKLVETSNRALREGHLFLFDPDSGNDQCHIAGVTIARLYNEIVRDQERTCTAEEERFITLSLIVSFSFRERLKDLVRFADPSLKPKKVNCAAEFLQGTMKQAKLAHAELLHTHFLPALQRPAEEAEELLALLSEPELGNAKRLGLPRYPKFSGVRLMNCVVAEEGIPLLFRVKSFCNHGFRCRTYVAMNGAGEALPLNELGAEAAKVACLVFEGVALPQTAIRKGGFEKFRVRRDACPEGFLSKAKEVTGHKCIVCTPCEQTDCLDHEEADHQFRAIATDVHGLLSAIGANFTAMEQGEEAERFFDSAAYPRLTAAFKKAQVVAEEQGLSKMNPSTFYIEHAHCDRLDLATSSDQRLLDQKVEPFLRARGVGHE